MHNNKKRLLIAGGGYADIPLIIAAKKLDYFVITSGNRPEDLGHHYSDEYHKVDFSDPEAILNLATRLKISAICACCNDFSALSAAYTAEQMGLEGHDPYETTKTIHLKDLYRQFALAHGITSPKALWFRNKKDALSGIKSLPFPIIVKPVDLTGGKGISMVSGIKETETAIDKAFTASKTKRIVVEEFITGSRHGFSAFIYNRRVVFFFSDNEHYFLNPYLVSAASAPGIVPAVVEQKLCSESERIASLLSLKSGIFHVQYILKDTEPVIIEICRRAPGDLYIKLVEHATGVDYSSWIVKASAGLDCSGLAHSETRGFYTRHCVMSKHPGTVKNVVFESSIRNNVIDQFMWWKKGDPITDFMTSKFGIVFLKFSSSEEMFEKTENLHELIRVEAEWGSHCMYTR